MPHAILQSHQIDLLQLQSSALHKKILFAHYHMARGDAATLLLAPILPVFVEKYPEIEIDIVASNRMIDVTEGGSMRASGTAERSPRT